MGLLDSFFKSKVKDLVLREEDAPDEISDVAVVIKGQKHFDIYQDGNGVIRAQHVSGNWLDTKDHLIDGSIYGMEFAKKFYNIEDCHKDCLYYIQSRMVKKIGTVEFIPYEEK